MPSDSPHHQIGQTVGAKLRAARQARKFTQSQLAQPDFSVSYISAIERGQIHPSLRALEILAARLGLTAADLLPRHGQEGAGEISPEHEVQRSDEEIELLFLEAQVAIRQGEPQAAITLLQGLVSKNLSRRQEITLRYLLGWAYFSLARLQEGESMLSEAAQLARESDDPLNPRILNLQGLVYASMHNNIQGLQLQQYSLELLQKEQPHEPFLLAQVYMNIGQHFSHLEQFNKAIEMFQQALAIIHSIHDADSLKSMYWSIAQHSIEAQEYQLATYYEYKWLQVDRQEQQQTLRSEIYHYLGRAMMKSNQEHAHTYLEQTLQAVDASQDELTQASIRVHSAEWQLAQGNTRQASQYVQQAQDQAAQYGDTMIAADASLLQGRIAYQEQDYPAGDRHFEAGLAILERLGAHEELIDQSACYAQLLEDRGEMQKAIIYWKKAYAYRQKDGKYRQD